MGKSKIIYDEQGVKLVNGDATEFLQQYSGPEFAAVVTDPPYGLGIQGIDRKQWDKGFPPADFWRLLWEKVETGGWLVSFSSSNTVHRSAVAIEDGGWKVQEIMAWIKPYAIGCRGKLRGIMKRGWDAIILASKNYPRPLNTKDCRVCGDGIPMWSSQKLPDRNRVLKIKRGNPLNRRDTRSPSSVVIAAEDSGLLGNYDRFFIVARATTREKGYYNYHPTVKPLTLMEHLIGLVRRPEGIILDPFVGSGTTLVAALRMGVPAVGVEIDASYCRIALRRVLDILNNTPLFG